MDRIYPRIPGEKVQWQGPAMPELPQRGKRMRGAGDLVKRFTDFVGIPQCEPCKDRQEWLNEKIPFGKGGQS